MFHAWRAGIRTGLVVAGCAFLAGAALVSGRPARG
jgi:hypothetical protein